ncbi:hypothetical protein JCM11641_003881 [Rhodosporidiobolus odoratus]
MSQSLALLSQDYSSLSKEAGRRHSDVRDAADKAAQLLKANPNKDTAFDELRADPPPAQHPLYQPIFLASTTRNAKVIALAVSALQRLIVAGAVPKPVVKQILDTLDQVIAQGVEIQLKVLQTLVSLLTTTTQTRTPGGKPRTDKLVQGEELGQALELSHRLSTSKIPVVASTASATLRQLFMSVFERVGEEDALVASASTSQDSDPATFLPEAIFSVDVPPLEEDRAAAVGTFTSSSSSSSAGAGKKRMVEGDAPETPMPDGASSASFPSDPYSSSTENSARSIRLRPAARDAYLLLEDLCLLISGSVEGGPDGEPSFLRWGSLSRTFGLELVESIVSGFGGIVRSHPELLLVLRAHLCPLLIRFLSSPPRSTLSTSTSFTFSFPLTLRLTRVIFLLLKQFSDLLTLESEVFLTMFIRVVGPGDKGEGEGGHPAGPAAGASAPLWMRVLALEIFRGLCGDFNLMVKLYARYDAATREASTGAGAGIGRGKGGSTVFSDLMTAFNRLATEKPTALGVGAAVVYGSSLGPTFSSASPVGPPSAVPAAAPSTSTLGAVTGSHLVDSAMEMGFGLAQAAGSVVGSAAAAAGAVAAQAGGTGSGGGPPLPSLSTFTASMRLQCIDQLDKADPPPVPDTYIFLLALQCLSALADGFATYALSAYGEVLARQARVGGKESARSVAPRALDWAALADSSSDPQIASLKVVRSMAETAWPALLASLSFFISTSLSDDLFADVLTSLQNFTSVLGVLNLETPREAFLTSLCKFAMPPAVVSHFASSQDHFLSTSSHASKPSSAAAAAATAVLSAGAESLALLATASGVTSQLPSSQSLTMTTTTTTNPIGLSSRNLSCLRALLSVAHYLAGSLGYSWFAVFETLQNAEFVLRATAAGAGGGGRARRRNVAGGMAPPGTPGRSSAVGGAAGSTGSGGATAPLGGGGGGGGGDTGDSQPIPVLPTEADELAIQTSIAKLFEVSKTLEDEAYRMFVGALCRLSGEMIGVQMGEDGSVVNRGTGGGGEEGGGGGSGTTTPGNTPDRSRRRSSGISTVKTRMGGVGTFGSGERSFGISKLGVVSTINVPRLIQGDPDKVGWDLTMGHFLFVLHCTTAPTSIRIQAAETLGQLLVLAPKNLESLSSSAPFSSPSPSRSSSTQHEDFLALQRRVQTQVLTALSSLASPAPRLQSSTDIDVRRLALESLLSILESNGHAFVAGWDRIFHVLRTACPASTFVAPPSPSPSSTSLGARRSMDTITERDSFAPMTPLRSSVGPGGGGGGGGYFGSGAAEGPARSAKTAVLVRTSFPSLQLICTDFLEALSPEEIRDCIGTLAEFGRQGEDVNVALTANGLLWSVSDHVQAKREEGDGSERSQQHGELWMYLLQNLLNLARDTRQEVRDAAVTNIFRSISMYGASLSKETWEACCWEIIFPLVEDISSTIKQANDDAASGADLDEETVPQVSGPPIRVIDKKLDDTKVLALRSAGEVFFEYLPQLVKTDRYEEIWRAFVSQLKRTFVEDRPAPATAAMQALEKVLTVSLDMSDASRTAFSWEVAWAAWDEIGRTLEENVATDGGEKIFTQVNLEAFVRVVLVIYTPPYIAFDLARVERLLAILKTVLTYTGSPDYRPDVDHLMPLQSSILEIIAVIKLDDVPGAPAAVLSDLSEYLKLAFTGSFESASESSVPGRGRVVQVVSFVALTKEVMPHVQWLYQKYSDDVSVYEQGAVRRMLEAYSLPMKLKHDCPAPAKFGSAEPLWKTATVNFLKAVKDVVAGLQRSSTELPESSHVAIWEQIVEGFAGALLAETWASSLRRSSTHPLTFQVFSGSHRGMSADQLRQEENFDLALLVSLEHDTLPSLGAAVVPDHLIRRLAKSLQIASRLYQLDYPSSMSSFDLLAASPSSSADVPAPPTPPPEEPRFELDFDEQVKGEMRGTTVEIVPVGRERFAYWCLDLLFLVCSREESAEQDPLRRRIAALALPSLMNRCAAVVKTYVADAPLRGKMPFPRIRQSELLYLLHSCLSLNLPSGALWASSQSSPSSCILTPFSYDPSLPLPQLVRSALLHSPRAHLYDLYPLFVDLLALSELTPAIKAPSWGPHMGLERDEEGKEVWEGLPGGIEVGRIGRSIGYPAAGAEEEEEGADVKRLVLRALKVVGKEVGAGNGIVM